MYQWIIGLGNYPERSLQYARTRHNTGGDLVLGLLRKLHLPTHGCVAYRHDQGVTTLGTLRGYINVSGVGLRKLVPRPALDSLLIVHDEVELPYGEIRFKFGGSAKGHNGLRNITEVMGTSEYARLRVGIGKQAPLRDYVLEKHTFTEWEIVQANIDYCYEALHDLINNNFQDKKNSG